MARAEAPRGDRPSPRHGTEARLRACLGGNSGGAALRRAWRGYLANVSGSARQQPSYPLGPGSRPTPGPPLIPSFSFVYCDPFIGCDVSVGSSRIGAPPPMAQSMNPVQPSAQRTPRLHILLVLVLVTGAFGPARPLRERPTLQQTRRYRRLRERPTPLPTWRYRWRAVPSACPSPEGRSGHRRAVRGRRGRRLGAERLRTDRAGRRSSGDAAHRSAGGLRLPRPLRRLSVRVGQP